MKKADFEWDDDKNVDNLRKHGIPFEIAQDAFFDKNKIIAFDKSHSKTEKRHLCFGKVGEGIMTVRFTYRKNKIRIFGAGYWRKGRKVYEEKN